MRKINITQSITNKGTFSIEKYLDDIKHIKQLTREEEEELVKLSSQGDREAINKLVTSNLRFVVSVVKKYHVGDNIRFEDLINEGNIGLILAAEKFNPEAIGRPIKFISFAVFYIQKLVLEYLSNHSKSIRLPFNKITNISKLNKVISEMEQKESRDISMSEVIYEMGNNITNDKVSVLENFMECRVDSLDTPIGYSDNDSRDVLSDLIADENCLSSDHLLIEKDFKSQIKGLLNILSPRDKYIIELSYGLNGGNPMKLDEVSKVLNLTRERVRQIKIKSLSKLNSKLMKII